MLSLGFEELSSIGTASRMISLALSSRSLRFVRVP